MLGSPGKIVAEASKNSQVTFVCLRADGEWVTTDPCSFLNCLDIFRTNSFAYVEVFGPLIFIKYGVLCTR